MLICSLKMLQKTIFLIYSMDNKIFVSKLLTLKDCMKILFMQIVKINLLKSAYIVINEHTVFKKKAQIPIKDRSDFMKKIIKYSRVGKYHKITFL